MGMLCMFILELADALEELPNLLRDLGARSRARIIEWRGNAEQSWQRILSALRARHSHCKPMTRRDRRPS